MWNTRISKRNYAKLQASIGMVTLSALRNEFWIGIGWSRITGVGTVDVGLLHVYCRSIQYPLVILAYLLLLASQLVLICEERAQPPYLPYMYKGV